MNTMLPALPKTLGRLSDIFISSLGSITGDDNRLGLKPQKRVCTILVDGLGAQNLSNAGGHAKFLNKAQVATPKMTCGFPSTTVASITSFATGLQPGQHGLVGYQVKNPKTQTIENLLTGWGPNMDPLEWQPHETVSQMALRRGVSSFVIGPQEYKGSGFTMATMRDAQYLSAKSISERFEQADEILNKSDDALVYLYVPELDQIAHSRGTTSSAWLAKLEELDSACQASAKRISKNASIYLTADHGIIDVAANKHIYLDEFDNLLPGLEAVGGDPRVNYLYFDVSVELELPRIATELQAALGNAVVIARRQDLISAGWFGATVTDSAIERLPELFVIALAQVAIYHRRFAKPKSLQMIGQHGSVSSAELAIPFLNLGI